MLGMAGNVLQAGCRRGRWATALSVGDSRCRAMPLHQGASPMGPSDSSREGAGTGRPSYPIETAWKNGRGVVTENVLKARFFKGTRVIEGVAWQPHRPG